MTNNVLTEALFAGQQELLRAIRSLSAGRISEDVLKNLDTVFKERVDAHFAAATRQILEQYSQITRDLEGSLMEPIAHPPYALPDSKPEHPDRSFRRKGRLH